MIDWKLACHPIRSPNSSTSDGQNMGISNPGQYGVFCRTPPLARRKLGESCQSAPLLCLTFVHPACIHPGFSSQLELGGSLPHRRRLKRCGLRGSDISAGHWTGQINRRTDRARYRKTTLNRIGCNNTHWAGAVRQPRFSIDCRDQPAQRQDTLPLPWSASLQRTITLILTRIAEILAALSSCKARTD
jgi:hypothetical protein